MSATPKRAPVRPRRLLAEQSTASRIIAAERGELADGPELFLDLPEREEVRR